MDADRRSGAGKSVLISGGGISGLTLAYWLRQHGLQPTIVERAPGPRPEGYAIDFAGSGWDVAERMNLIPTLQQDQISVDYFIFKDDAGRTLARLPVSVFRQEFEDKMVQTMRPDLEAALYGTIRDTVPFRSGLRSSILSRRPIMSQSPSQTVRRKRLTC